MKHEARIAAAMEHGEIRKIVIIDDAFDPPTLGDADVGAFLDLVEKPANATTLRKAGVTETEAREAADAITSSNYSEDALKLVVGKLYAKFVERLESRFDPAGRFAILKGDNLRRVRPLLLLLAKVRQVTVVRIGSDAAGVDFASLEPDVVFVDYYLDASLRADEVPDELRGSAARRASIAMLRQVLEAKPGFGPSLMLMSSHSVKQEATAFRREIREKRKVFASRFQYLSKDDLDEEDDGSIGMSTDAADALLNIAQHHKFAGAVEEGLTLWKQGLDEAAARVWDLINELELKDLAYLARFRLAEEGQPLSSYLEWFFGEVLVDAIAKSVKWDDQSFKVLDEGAVKNKPGSQVEGAFDGPTGRVADLYYRARVDERPSRQGVDLRTGDLYLHKDRPDELLATVTPDCDLVERRGRRGAKRLTLVAGAIRPINAPDSSIADFFKRGSELVNIVWEPKDIRTMDYSEIRDDKYRLLGTLRPLYALELQRRVLADLGRVGLAVAPAMAVTARSRVVVQSRAAEPLELALPGADAATCAVIPKRGATDKARIVYHRSFAAALLDALLDIPEDLITDDGTAMLKMLRQAKSQVTLVEKLCRDGQLDGDEAFGILSTLQQERRKKPVPWCQILVSHEESATEYEADNEPNPTPLEVPENAPLQGDRTGTL